MTDVSFDGNKAAKKIAEGRLHDAHLLPVQGNWRVGDVLVRAYLLGMADAVNSAPLPYTKNHPLHKALEAMAQDET